MTLKHFRFSIYHELSRAQQLLHTDDLPVERLSGTNGSAG